MIDKTPAERIVQALLWLGFEDVEIGKRFSSTKFEKNENNVIEAEIIYASKDNLIPKSVEPSLIKFMENVLNYHQAIKDYKDRKDKNYE